MIDLDEALPDAAIDAVLSSIEDDASGNSSPPALLSQPCQPETYDTEPEDITKALATCLAHIRHAQMQRLPAP
jgi:hypothetical protein